MYILDVLNSALQSRNGVTYRVVKAEFHLFVSLLQMLVHKLLLECDSFCLEEGFFESQVPLFLNDLLVAFCHWLFLLDVLEEFKEVLHMAHKICAELSNRGFGLVYLLDLLLRKFLIIRRVFREDLVPDIDHRHRERKRELDQVNS